MTASVEDLARASKAVDDLLARVRAEQWGVRTPCREWDLRGLVGHLVGVNVQFAAMVSGGPVSEFDTQGDPVQAYRDSAAALLTTFDGPGVLERQFPGAMGIPTVGVGLQLRLTDLVTHGWDLVQATGIPIDLPADLAEDALKFLREQLAIRPRGTQFDEPQPIADTAPALDRLAAFSGRSVPPRG